MKKIIALTLVLMLIASLYGCCINTPITPELGDNERIPAAEETEKKEPVSAETEDHEPVPEEEDPAAARLRDAQMYHTYLTTGGLQNVLGYIEEDYATVESCLVDLNEDGVYELLLKLTDTQYLGVRGYASVSVLFGIENSQVVELTKAEYTGGSMGGHYVELRYDAEQEKYVAVKTGIDRVNMLEYTNQFEAYSYDGKALTPYHTATGVSYSVAVGYYDEYIAAVEKETTQYYKNEDQFYYYQINEDYVTEEDYNKVDERFVFPSEQEYKLKEGTVENPLALSQSELSGWVNNEAAAS